MMIESALRGIRQLFERSNSLLSDFFLCDTVAMTWESSREAFTSASTSSVSTWWISFFFCFAMVSSSYSCASSISISVISVSMRPRGVESRIFSILIGLIMKCVACGGYCFYCFISSIGDNLKWLDSSIVSLSSSASTSQSGDSINCFWKLFWSWLFGYCFGGLNFLLIYLRDSLGLIYRSIFYLTTLTDWLLLSAYVTFLSSYRIGWIWILKFAFGTAIRG